MRKLKFGLSDGTRDKSTENFRSQILVNIKYRPEWSSLTNLYGVDVYFKLTKVNEKSWIQSNLERKGHISQQSKGHKRRKA